MDYIQQIFSKIDFSSFSDLSKTISGPQMIFAGLLLVFLLLYGLSLGRTRALVSLLGIYIAYVFNATFIYFSELYRWIPLKDTNLIRVVALLVVYLGVFYILDRSLVKARLTLKEASFFSVFIISVLQLGLLISIITNTLSYEMLAYFPGPFLLYFSTKTALFYWAIVPILMLIFLKRHE